MKRERWGSLLVQEKYREEMPVTRDDNKNNNNRRFRYFPDECVSLGFCRKFRTKEKGNHLPAQNVRITEFSSGSYGVPRVDKGTTM